MRYELQVQGFDMLDQVFIHLRVRGRAESLGAPQELVLTRTATTQGVGETDPAIWARDALVMILETL